ncbi:MAG: helix-turn-helix transcriptional regulator [Bacteroidetes bacterium]|nr:helix-turn-helix transcriptional regulator [Bacteroidota bacterium]
MTSKRENIGELEELVLLMVGVLGNNAYGNAVVEEINSQADRSLTLSAVHAVLLRLEKKGLLESQVGGATKERGGRRKRFFSVTGKGMKVLEDIKHTRNRLWNIIVETN